MENKFTLRTIHTNLIYSFLITFIICCCIYLIKVHSLDSYNYFIYGDTIFAKRNKEIDLMIFVYFFCLYPVLFFVFQNKIKTKDIVSIDLNIYCYFKHATFKKLALSMFNIIICLYCLYCSSNLIKTLVHIKHINILIVIPIICCLIYLWKLNKFKLIPISQLAFSFSPLLVINEIYHFQGHELNIPMKNELKILMWGICCLLFLVSMKEIKRGDSVLTASIFFILMLSVGTFERIYVPDEYHLGEIFTPFHQLFELNQKAYSEYIPTKGMTHVIIGWLNHVFFNGNYMTILLSSRVTAIIFNLISILILNKYISNEKLFFLAIFNCFPVFDNYYPILIGLFILSSDYICKNNYRLLITSVFFGMLYFVYYNAFGIVFCLSLIPALLIVVAHIYREKLKPSRFQLFMIALFLIGVVIEFDFIYNSVLYCIENAKDNIFYWGNYGSGRHIIKSNYWVILHGVIFYVLYMNFRTSKTSDRIWFSFLIFFPIVLLSYMEGRADSIFPRGLTFSNFYCLAAIAFVFYSRGLKRNDKRLIFIYSFALMLLFNPHLLKRVIPHHLKLYETINIGPNVSYVKNSDIPNLGMGFIAKKRYEDLDNEYQLIKKLKADETFLIVDPYASQSARYTIFNKKIPTLSHAMINISSLKSQKKELNKVRKSHVKIIRISEGLFRHQLFYKYFLNGKYSLAGYKGKKYLIENELFDTLEKEGMVHKASLDDMHLIIPDMGYLPVKWGSAVSHETFTKLIDINKQPYELHHVKPVNNHEYVLGNQDPYLVYRIKNSSRITATTADFVLIDLSLVDVKECDAQLFWNNDVNHDFNEKHSVRFKVRSGMNVVPVSNNYLWFKSDKIEKIRLDFDRCSNKSVHMNTFDFAVY